MIAPKSPSQPWPAAALSGSAFAKRVTSSHHSLDGKTGILPSTEHSLDARHQPPLVRSGLRARGRIAGLLLLQRSPQRVRSVPGRELHFLLNAGFVDDQLEQALLVEAEVDLSTRRTHRNLDRPQILVVHDQVAVSLKDVHFHERRTGILGRRKSKALHQWDDRVLLDDLPKAPIGQRVSDR